nr:MAG TPA: hypothetical protein [Caudoviricetes sp.]DAS34110.1 MAG TPA: hypothetical protein [Caudoviricetes sp.]
MTECGHPKAKARQFDGVGDGQLASASFLITLDARVHASACARPHAMA